MDVRQMKSIPSNLTVTTLTIETNEKYECKGSFYNVYNGSHVKFGSILQLLKELENMFDRFTFPQVTHEYRTFCGGNKRKSALSKLKKENIIMPETPKDDFTESDSSKKATFILQVKFRRNATWQGQVQWIDKNITKKFRSTLELIRLLDSAIEQQDKTLSWEDDPQNN